MKLTTEQLRAEMIEKIAVASGLRARDGRNVVAEAIYAEVVEPLLAAANREAQPLNGWRVTVTRTGDRQGVASISGPGGFCMEVPVELSMLDFMEALTAPPAPAVPDDVQRDADRWRAMLGSARIRILGAAGFGATGLPGGDPDYRHFGMEIWTHYPGWLTEKNEYGIDILTKYADICRAAMLDGAK